MSDLARSLEDYLALRRSLGYKLQRTGQVLADFVAYLDAAGETHISVEAAVAWAVLPVNAESSWRACRLGAVRSFARYLQALDTNHQVPPAGIIPRGRRPNPYLFSDADIAALMAATRELGSPQRQDTFETLIGLLAVTGLRIGEAIRLDRGDVDLGHGLLEVRHSKADTSRDVPLHPSTLRALGDYCVRRDQLFPDADALFVTTTGTRLQTSNIGVVFAQLAAAAGLHNQTGGQRPRVGGLRHSFAVRALLGCYSTSGDVGPMLPALSLYLGHVKPASTYWYLSAAPQLLAAAARRAEATLGGLT
jgi:integrase/recombinase XerD